MPLVGLTNWPKFITSKNSKIILSCSYHVASSCLTGRVLQIIFNQHPKIAMGVLIFNIRVCFYLSNCSCHQDLDMRFGFNLCSEEMAFLEKRKRYVASALKNVFHLPHDLQDQEVRVCLGDGTWISSAFVYCKRVVSRTGHSYLLCRYLLARVS